MECAKGFLSDVVDTFDEAFVTLLVAIDAGDDERVGASGGICINDGSGIPKMETLGFRILEVP